MVTPLDGVRDMTVQPPRAGASAAEYITTIRQANRAIENARKAMKAIAIQATDDGYNWEALRNAATNSAKPEEQVQLMAEYLAEYWAESDADGQSRRV